MSTKRSGLATILMAFVLLLTTATWATAGVTSIVLNSDPGDYIGGGEFVVYGESDGAFLAQTNGNVVGVYFNTPTFSHWWQLEFAAADGQLLTVGTYEGAVRHPFEGPGQPGLWVAGDGRGCNMLTGRFEVLELVLGGGSDVVSFRATFEQHCEGASAALRGEVRYNANVPVELTVPSAFTVFENETASFIVTALHTQGGGHVTLSASNVPLGASFLDHGNNTATFSWTPLSSQSGIYLIGIQGTAGAFVETAYVRITVRLAPPMNDEIDNAVPITGVPFTYTQQTITATGAPDDPYCFGTTTTVWFAYTPTVAGRVEFNAAGSDFLTTLSAYTGTRGNLTQLACNYGGADSRIRFDVSPGVTYYIMAGAPPWAASGTLTLNAVPAPPPFTMLLTLDPFSSIDPFTGQVVVKGTVTCSAPSFMHLNGSIRQARARTELMGHFGGFVECDGVTPWEAQVHYSTIGLFQGRSSALFVGGAANVTMSGFGYDPVEGTFVDRNATATVRLRGGN